MDKKEILRRLLKEGVMPRPEDLEKLDEITIEDFIKSKISPKHPTPEKIPNESVPEISVSVRPVEKNPKLSTQDFTAFYRDRFQRIRDLLIKKVDAISINKTKNVFSTTSVIGMVKEKTGLGFVLEDETGEIEMVTDQNLEEDDVVAVTGAIKEGRLFSADVIYPGIPFNRTTGKLNHVKAFLGNAMPENKTEDVFLIPSNSIKDEKTVSGFLSPIFFDIIKGKSKITLLYYKPAGTTKIKTVEEWLKRRYIPTSREDVPGPTDPLVLEPIPDVIWLDTEEKERCLHRGALVVTTGPNGVTVDLEKKEAEFH